MFAFARKHLSAFARLTTIGEFLLDLGHPVFSSANMILKISEPRDRVWLAEKSRDHPRLLAQVAFNPPPFRHERRRLLRVLGLDACRDFAGQRVVASNGGEAVDDKLLQFDCWNGARLAVIPALLHRRLADVVSVADAAFVRVGVNHLHAAGAAADQAAQQPAVFIPLPRSTVAAIPPKHCLRLRPRRVVDDGVMLARIDLPFVLNFSDVGHVREQPGQVKQAVEALTTNPGEFKTLVIDSIDWAEKFLIEDVCRRRHEASIEEFGYGKGYTYLAEEFAGFLRSLDVLRDRGMHIVLLGHCSIRKFEQPEAAGAYDRYELKLSKQVAPLVREWVDALFFANYFTRVAESDSGKKRGVGGKERVLYTSHCAAWDAKNRHGLEEKLPFDYAAIAHVFDPGVAAPPAAAPKTDGGNDAKLAALFAGRDDAINAFLVARGEITAQQTWRDAKPDYKARVFKASRLSPSMKRFLAVSKSTLSSRQGRRVLAMGALAASSASLLPGQSR